MFVAVMVIVFDREQPLKIECRLRTSRAIANTVARFGKLRRETSRRPNLFFRWRV
jgi:hypothetical protein